MINGARKINRTVRWGMVGGGATSQIGYIHRCAAMRDNYFKLVAGAFDIDAERCKTFGEELLLDRERCYSDYKEMFTKEAQREDGIEAVSVATPNHTHYEICKAALEAGLHVICEKPLCFTSAEGEELVALAKKQNKIIGVTYGYSGYQLIHQARKMIENGEIGEVRMVHMQFSHGWHNEAVELQSEGLRWRVTPKYSGPTYVLGDLATHTLFLGETMVPNFKIKRLMCSRQSFIKTRAPLEDNAYVIMECEDGIMGHLWTSAVNSGSIHGQIVRVVGSKASIEWWDERPNQLQFTVQGQPAQILERGLSYLYPRALEDDRIGAGHAEGLFESWANLYERYALAIDATDRNDQAFLSDFWYPNGQNGTEGVRWLENCVRSADDNSSWVDYK